MRSSSGASHFLETTKTPKSQVQVTSLRPLGAFATWATVVLVRDKGMDETGAAITLGVVTLLAGATGTFGGGWLADRVAARRHNGYFIVCAVSTLAGIVPTLMVLIADSPLHPEDKEGNNLTYD